MNMPIGDKLFRDIPHRVAKFRENRPRDVEKSGGWKKTEIKKTTRSVNAKRDGHPAEHRWRPLFNAAKFG